MSNKYTKLARNSLNIILVATAPFGTFSILPEIASVMLPHINNISLYSSALAYGGSLGSLIFAIPLCMFFGISFINDFYLSNFNQLMLHFALLGLVAFSALIGSHLLGIAVAGPMLTGLVGFGVVTVFNLAVVALIEFMLETFAPSQAIRSFEASNHFK